MERRRRTAAILAGSLAAHTLLLGAYLATHPAPRYAEPPVFQVELIRPPPRKPPRPEPIRPRPATAALATTTPVLHLAPPPPAPAGPVAPRPIDPRRMTDQELVERAGPRPDIARLHQELAKRPLYSSRLPPGPDDCKPASEHSDRIAPPCPVFVGGAPPPSRLPNRPDLAGEVATKDAFKAYGERYGPHGMANPNDFPGLGCKNLHIHCGAPPPDPGVIGSTLPRP